MGIDTERFVPDTVDHELVICPICLDVLDKPLELRGCQHVFCTLCLREAFVSGERVCPLDRTQVTVKPTRPNRARQIVLDRLRIKCQFWNSGCREVLSVEQIKDHEQSCEKNPDAERSSAIKGGTSRSGWFGSSRASADSTDGFPRSSDFAGGNGTGNQQRQEQDNNSGVWVLIFGVFVFVLFKILSR
ncbi:hypothetical protein RvY_06382 [Ramazzottius varieornatus]|uniref:RING-type domain-containing protein n=1 Tax=Ramazzottius varieornatus TaxID=947166 RepID=A0A1D1UYE8_RAMVA|nr:hypothetical protein RvY_06382 [Ramazzottius varieornatus]